LLYVAVTRARDALYLAAEVDKDGILRAPKRSLANLLPHSLKVAFTRAFATEDAEVHWDALGQEFAARVCRPAAAEAPPVILDPLSAMPSDDVVDRQPLYSSTPVIRSATSSEAEIDPREFFAVDTDSKRERSRERLAGTLVHRLLQRPWDGLPSLDEVVEQVGRLTGPAELVDVPDRGEFFGHVAEAFLKVAGRQDVRGWLSAGQPSYEVPFSYQSPQEPGVIIRGSIDCLVVHPDGSVRVLEFKTGLPRPEHAAQLGLYIEVVRNAFPGAAVTGELVYPDRAN
jgi:ATP-dependent exoDNAse (exonuclease V) beta subunit